MAGSVSGIGSWAAVPVQDRSNNFDLIRLLSAMNVMLLHVSDHLHVSLGALRAVLEAIPGVPVFFVVSGYLITLARERTPGWLPYLRNRIIRIYPALWVCFGLSVVTLWATGFEWGASRLGILGWIASQLSVLQFVTPTFLNGYGVGVLNGSLWTIPVELQFYIALPLLLAAGPMVRYGLSLASIGVAVMFYDMDVRLSGAISIPLKVTLLPNLYMFMLGVLVATNRDALLPWLRGRFPVWCMAYLFVAWVGAATGVSIGTNNPNPIAMVFLAGLVLSAAFSAPTLSRRVLHGNDISYGLYIYHMVVVNILLTMGSRSASVALLLSVACGIASWLLIERPALLYKVR